MSSLNVILQRDCALVFADAASCRQDTYDTIARIEPKIALQPPLNCVLGMRGIGMMLPPLVKRIATARIRDFDELVTGIGPLLRPALDEALRETWRASGWRGRFAGTVLPRYLQRRLPGTEFEIVLVGWSKAKGAPAGFWCRTGFAVEPLPAAIFITPSPSAEAMNALAWTCPDDPEKFDIQRDGVAAMRAQRGTWAGRRNGLIGGYIQLAIVNRTHVNSTILWRWPDEIGKRPPLEILAPLKPKPAAPFPGGLAAFPR